MNYKRAYQLLKEIGFVRTGGSSEEKRAANILLEMISKNGGEGYLEDFEVQSQKINHVSLSTLEPMNKSYNVSAYGCSGSTPIEGISAPFYYMESIGEVDKVKAKGKIVLVNEYVGQVVYKSIAEAKAIGFISYSGDVCRDDEKNSDLDIRELRATLSNEYGKIPGVHMRAKDALDLVKSQPELINLKILQEETNAISQNVIAKINGTESSEEIVFTAHYDSVPFSTGVYDNGAGSVILMELYLYFLKNPPKRNLTFIWTGCEERGLLGAKAYVAKHQEELSNIILCINVDVGGAVLGKEVAIVTADSSLANYVDYLAKIEGVSLLVKQDIYSSDAIPFADKGIPGINFSRTGATGGWHIHDRHDTLKFLSAKALEKTGLFTLLFAKNLVNAVAFPVNKELPTEIVNKINKYLNKKQ